MLDLLWRTCFRWGLRPHHLTGDSIYGSLLRRSFDERYAERVRAYHETEACKKEAMRKRQVWIEPLFGEAKQWHGMGRMRLRTLERANCEVLISASGQNIKRLLEFGGGGPRRPAQVAALRPPTRPPLHLDRQRHGGHRRSLARYRGVFQHAGAFSEVAPGIHRPLLRCGR
jgi:hypothetical protein